MNGLRAANGTPFQNTTQQGIQDTPEEHPAWNAGAARGQGPGPAQPEFAPLARDDDSPLRTMAQDGSCDIADPPAGRNDDPAGPARAGQSDPTSHGPSAQPPHDPLDCPWTPVAYTAEQLADLAHMIEEEKLAGDLYEVLAAQTGLDVFSRIAVSEDRHYASLLAVAEDAGLDLGTIPTLPAGQFQDPGMQALYDTLLAAAAASDAAALEAGLAVESTDIADLGDAIVGLVGTPLGNVYANLLDGSNAHLAAFDALLGA